MNVTKLILVSAVILFPFSVFANDFILNERLTDPLDMDDFISVGYGNRGMGASFGYLTKDNSVEKNVLIIGGEGLINSDDTVNEVSIKYETYNKVNGYGTSFKVLYDFEDNERSEESSEVSYGFFKEFVKTKNIKLYPEVGLGVKIENNPVGGGDIGYTIPGSFGYAGFHSSFLISEQVALEVNPFLHYALSGSNSYLEGAYGDGQRMRVITDINVKYAFQDDMQLTLASSLDFGGSLDESKLSVIFTHFY